MFDQIVGLILLGLGITKQPNGDVQGLTTTSQLQEVEDEEEKKEEDKVEESETKTAILARYTPTPSLAVREKRRNVIPTIAYRQHSVGSRGPEEENEQENEEELSTTPGTSISPSDDDDARVKNIIRLIKNDQPREVNVARMTETKKSELQKKLKQKVVEAYQKSAEARKEYQKKLSEIKNEQKKTMVKRLDGGIQTANEKRTQAMGEQLSKMLEILEKLNVRVGSAKTTGIDLSKVESAITSARASIVTAQTAVTEQAGKSYVFSFNSEETAGNGVRTSLSNFEADLQAVREKITTAHAAVVSAMTFFGDSVGGGKE